METNWMFQLLVSSQVTIGYMWIKPRDERGGEKKRESERGKEKNRERD